MDALPRLLLTNAAAAGLIALLAWTASRAVRRHAVVHGLWLLALVKLVTPPIAPLPVIPAAWRLPELGLARPVPTVALMPARAGGVASAPRPLAEEPTPRLPAAPASPAPGAALALGLGALAVTLLAAWRFARFSRLLGCARPAPPALVSRADALAVAIGLRSAPPVLLVPARVPPLLWPHPGGPRLLLPEGLLAQLGDDELDGLVVHELAHLRRRDHWVRLLEVAATALFWWYPVTWWARTALRRAEERCCDEWVLRVLPRSASAYANGLLKSLTFLADEPDPLPAVASGIGPVRDLEARLKEILMTRPAPRLAAPLRLVLATAAALGLAAFPTHARPVAAQAEAPAPVAKPALAAPAAAPAARPAPQAAPAPAKAPAARPDDAARKALQDERRALEEARRQLHQKELELARRQVELEKEAQQAELRARAEELRGQGKAEEAARLERERELVARRAELQGRQLRLEEEHMALERQFGAQVVHEKAREELAWKQQQLEREMKEAQKRAQADATEARLKAMQEAGEDVEAQLEHEIQRLQAALEAVRARQTAKPTPRPEP